LGTKDDLVQATKSFFVKRGTEVLLGALTIEAPAFFGDPVIHEISKKLIEHGLRKLADQGEIGAFFIYIDWHVTQQGRAFADAILKYHAAAMSGTPEEFDVAEKNAVDAARALIRFSS
jgi:hypothetical protein